MDSLLLKIQSAEVECLVKEESITRSEHEGCTARTLGLIASHFLSEVADPDTLPLRMFDICDWDNDGYHCFEEAVQFAAITSGGPLDKESWLTICQEVDAEPNMGLRFKDYAKLMDQDLDQMDVDHAFTARQHTERGRNFIGDSTRARAYDDMHVRSAPTGALFEQGTTLTRSRSSSSRLSSNLTRKSVSVKDTVVGAILAEVGNVTDLTGVVSQKKRRRSRRKKSNKSSSNSSKTNGSIHISELSSVASVVNELSVTEPVESKPRRTTKGLRTTRLKTIICRNWEAGNCQYGAECGFAHGDLEVKQPVQPACKHWAANGACERGTACAFSHASPAKQ
eukprot:TRINITY_DN480_c0_g1_i2.p1 TRINITY_DN480_c0_g1~~TRINITY_DN480_c0_g1_i2.p1  ORF type:complete len:338 (+),score=50.36 TRINITY_DN480_c0_g1_i2:54-1067(+)